jgi:hypothetical protein
MSSDQPRAKAVSQLVYSETGLPGSKLHGAGYRVLNEVWNET